jgi:hypothetical protein
MNTTIEPDAVYLYVVEHVTTWCVEAGANNFVARGPPMHLESMEVEFLQSLAKAHHRQRARWERSLLALQNSSEGAVMMTLRREV